MSQEQKATLEACLQELHLPTMRRESEAVARQAQQESWSYQDFLRELAEREMQQRRQNRIARLLKASRLPLEKNWQSLDLKRLPTKAVQQLRSSAGRGFSGSPRECAGVRDGGFGEDAQPVCGGPGTGAARAGASCSRRRACWCRNCSRRNAIWP